METLATTAAQLTASHAEFLASRPDGADEDVHMLPHLVDHVIETYSAPGETVFDPFAGFGTTLDRAVALGRSAIGIELLPERVELVRERVPAARLYEGDARELGRILRREAKQPSSTKREAAPAIDLVLTSPPYMTETHHEADPLTAYERDGGDYRRYLTELALISAQCARIVRPGGYVVWNVADIEHAGHTTQLIDDCAGVLARHLERVAVVEVAWDRYPHDLVRDALLVFRRYGATAG